MSSKDSLCYLPSPIEILQSMKTVSHVWGLAGLPEVVHQGSQFCLPVKGGSITLTTKEDAYRLEFNCFPYKPVSLEQTRNSLSWTIIEGNKNSISNAIDMTEVLFMSEAVLYHYVNEFVSIHKLVPSEEYIHLALGQTSPKITTKAGNNSE